MAVGLGTLVPATAGNAATDGLTFTVLRYERVSSKNQLKPPLAGGYFSVADVKVCAAVQSVTIDPTIWTLIDSDSSQTPADATASSVNLPGPDLSATSYVVPGQCVSGWVEFDIPGGVTPTEIQANGANNYYWPVR
jgi:Domain of unknown function (DUF4352)